MKPTTRYEDDSMLAHGFGLTDIVKVPRNFGNEPSDEEYRAGMDRILDLIRIHEPKAAIFVYKGVLDQVLRLKFEIREKARYGFNPTLQGTFGVPVFAFPLPSVGNCTRDQAAEAMRSLRDHLNSA